MCLRTCSCDKRLLTVLYHTGSSSLPNLDFPTLSLSWSISLPFQSISIFPAPELHPSSSQIHSGKREASNPVLHLLSQDLRLPNAKLHQSLSHRTFPSPPVSSCAPPALSRSCRSPGLSLLVAFTLPSHMLPWHALIAGTLVDGQKCYDKVEIPIATLFLVTPFNVLLNQTLITL